jgi:hypothetical protein
MAMVPETRGKSLEEIESHMKEKFGESGFGVTLAEKISWRSPLRIFRQTSLSYGTQSLPDPDTRKTAPYLV